MPSILRAIFARWTPDHHLMHGAQQLAIAAFPLVSARVEAGRLPRRRAEARGYIRAKATPIVRKLVAAHCRQTSVRQSMSGEQMLSEATERVVRLLVGEANRGQHGRAVAEMRRAA